MKICSSGPGHMTFMGAMPICGKNPYNTSPEPNDGWPEKVCM